MFCAVRKDPVSQFNQPVDHHDLPRVAGINSFMRLPVQDNVEGLDACFVGVPLDTGTSNRPGARFGPRQMRNESSLLRPTNHGTGDSPFQRMQVADIGDVVTNLYNLPKACEDIYNQYRQIVRGGCIPLSMGGDHVVTYPILRAIHEKYGKVGLIHVDAHSDTAQNTMGERLSHGTPFRCAWEDGLLDNDRVIQIGLHTLSTTGGDTHGNVDWGQQQGWRLVRVEECWHKFLTPLMSSVRSMMGDGPVYLSFDIDAIDPGFCPGTGTPEIGGLTTIQALEIIRGCLGLKLVGCDLVEVSPPYDPTGTTSLTGANLLFEMLCALPDKRPKGAQQQ